MSNYKPFPCPQCGKARYMQENEVINRYGGTPPLCNRCTQLNNQKARKEEADDGGR